MKSTVSPQEQFARIQGPELQRSTFDRSHGYKTTFDAGQLIPFFVDEALPGDTLNMRANIFGRLATPLKPVMDNMFIDIHFFSVPERLVWDNWKKFNGEQKNPADTTNFIMPTMTSPAITGYAENSLADYMGLPTKVAGLEHRSDFMRAYNLIYNEWYRDENLQNSVVVDTDDGPDSPSDYVILPRGKRKDYFTSALPWAQKATPVSIPIGTSAPLTGSGLITRVANAPNWKTYQAGTQTRAVNSGGFDIGNGDGSMANSAISTLYSLDPNGGLELGLSGITADLSAATAATINQLREAFQIQRMYERDARGGTRYTELLRSHFGVVSPDSRLQRPEYLGGGTANVNVNPIAQTAPTSGGSTPQGNLAAMGTFSMGSKGFVKSFTEHEIIIGLISARADLNYQQGMNRMWSRSTRFDFFWPSLAHLGEQAILNKEIYAQGTSDDDDVFGYQERYAEYRYKPSVVTSLFRSNATTSLDVWHLSQEFSALPALNAAFIVENPPIDRIIAVPSEPHFIADVYMNYICARPMPTYATPGLIDHF